MLKASFYLAAFCCNHPIISRPQTYQQMPTKLLAMAQKYFNVRTLVTNVL